VKYELVCSIGNPRIIWLSGPWKGGASDPTIANVSGAKEVLKEGLIPKESFLADKMYKGDKISFMTPLPGHRHYMRVVNTL
jgi:DDE superfamily endonuclease